MEARVAKRGTVPSALVERTLNPIDVGRTTARPRRRQCAIGSEGSVPLIHVMVVVLSLNAIASDTSFGALPDGCTIAEIAAPNISALQPDRATHGAVSPVANLGRCLVGDLAHEVAQRGSSEAIRELSIALRGLFPLNVVLVSEERVSGDIDAAQPFCRVRRIEYSKSAVATSCIVTTSLSPNELPESPRDSWDPPRREFDYTDQEVCVRAIRSDGDAAPRRANFTSAKEGPDIALESFLGWARGLFGMLPIDGDSRVERLLAGPLDGVVAQRVPWEGYPCEITIVGRFGEIAYTLASEGAPPVRLRLSQTADDVAVGGAKMSDDPPSAPRGTRVLYPRVGIARNTVDIDEVEWAGFNGCRWLTSLRLRQVICYRDGRSVVVQRTIRALAEAPAIWRPLTDLPEGTAAACDWAPGILWEVRDHAIAPVVDGDDVAEIDRLTSSLSSDRQSRASDAEPHGILARRTTGRAGYCGVYSVYACARLLGKRDLAMEELLRPEFVGRAEGSTILELSRAIESQSLHSQVCAGATVDLLALAEAPMILHVRASPRSKEADHYVVLAAKDGPNMLILDGARMVKVTIDELSVYWDGTVILVGNLEVPHSLIALEKFWRLAVSLAVLVGAVAVLKFSRGGMKLARSLEGTNLIWQVSILSTVAVILGLALTGFAGERLLSDQASIEFARRSVKPNFVRRIDLATARAQHAAGVQFVDARVSQDFERAHIEGAINVFADVSPGARSAATAHLNKALPVVVYCASSACPLADALAADLYYDGFQNVVVFANGMVDWNGGQP